MKGNQRHTYSAQTTNYINAPGLFGSVKMQDPLYSSYDSAEIPAGAKPFYMDSNSESTSGSDSETMTIGVAIVSDTNCRFHSINPSRDGREEIKYRSATGTFRATTGVEGQRQHDTVINCVLWSDNKLVACASADLGTAQMMKYRQQERHRHPIPVPKMIVVRGKNFRAVDQIDQLRLGKTKFVFICKSKPWPKVFWGLIEVHVVNVYIIVIEITPGTKKPTQREFRWQLVTELLDFADELDAVDTHNRRSTNATANDANTQIRHSTDSKTLHYFASMSEYVTPDRGGGQGAADNGGRSQHLHQTDEGGSRTT